MNDQTDNKQGFLRDKLGDYQVNPPEKVWESISGQLGSGRSRRTLYILALAAAGSLALAISLGLHYFGPDLPKEPVMAEETVQGEITSPEDAVVREIDQAQDGAESLSPLEERVLTAIQKQVPDQEQIVVQEQVVAQDLVSDTEQALDENVDPVSDMEQALDENVDPGQEAPEDPVPVTALALEGNDQLPNEAVADFLDHPKRDVRWMVGVAISPLYSFRDAEASIMAGAGVHESGILSYSSGVHVNYRRHSRLAFETGIFFNKTGVAISAPGIQLFSQQSDYLVLGNGSEQANIKAVTNSVGNIISNSGEIYVNGYKMNAANAPEALMDNTMDRLASSTAGIEQHLDYIELPFNLRYSVVDRTFELQLVGGMSTNFLVNNYVTMETDAGQEEIGYLSNIRNVNYSGNAGLGMIYHVSKKLNLMLEPRFRYFLNSINDSTLPSTRPYSIGLYTSLNYTF
jgi:hypothetical protein